MNAGAILNKLLLHSDPALVLNISTLQTILEDLIVKAKKKQIVYFFSRTVRQTTSRVGE